jgi:hypothetical protein
MVLQTNPLTGGNEMLSKTRTTIITAVAAISFAGAAVAPAVSQADTARGCPVVDSVTGKVLYYVAVGTKTSLMTCGADGEWHFGWLINAHEQPEVPPTKTYIRPVIGGSVSPTSTVSPTPVQTIKATSATPVAAP